MFMDWADRKEILQENMARRIRVNKESPTLARLEAQARANFRAEMDRRKRFAFQSVEWWCCDGRAQAWHEVATMLCEAKNGK